MNQQITAFVTGANRGLDMRFAAQLVERGAKVYAAARRPETIDSPGVVPVQLDITDPESVARAASLAGDVNVVINNAGVSTES
jgi:NAD(P)-dependent dehydrogenase (short-subunit alcohol dehydrogenase family)